MKEERTYFGGLKVAMNCHKSDLVPFALFSESRESEWDRELHILYITIIESYCKHCFSFDHR